MITISDLSLNFSGEPLFKDVNLKFTQGTATVLSVQTVQASLHFCAFCPAIWTHPPARFRLRPRPV